MKIRSTIIAASAALTSLVLTASAAQATLIDFNDLKKPSGETYVYGDYTDPTGEYQLTADRCSSGNTCFITTVNKGLSGIDFGQTGLVNYQGSAVTTLTRVDGEAFTLGTIDFAPASGNYSGYAPVEIGILFTFTFADGSDPLSETILIPNTPGERLTRTTLDFSGHGALTALSWKPTTNSGGFVQFDNINVALDASAVPEPATWAMMLGGLGLAGGALRSGKRKPRASVA